MTTPHKDIQTWLRLVSKNIYVRRRQLDTKAGAMFSMTAGMAGLGFTAYPHIRHDPAMVLLVGSFIAVCFVATYFAVHAMHPRITGPGRPSEDDAVPMLTTFEHFRNMSEAEYIEAVRGILTDSETIRASLALDIHEVGSQLGKRFQWLRIGYLLFGTALVMVVVTFIYIQWKMFT